MNKCGDKWMFIARMYDFSTDGGLTPHDPWRLCTWTFWESRIHVTYASLPEFLWGLAYLLHPCRRPITGHAFEVRIIRYQPVPTIVSRSFGTHFSLLTQKFVHRSNSLARLTFLVAAYSHNASPVRWRTTTGALQGYILLGIHWIAPGEWLKKNTR